MIDYEARDAAKRASAWCAENPDSTDGFKATNLSFEIAFEAGARWQREKYSSSKLYVELQKLFNAKDIPRVR